MSKHTEGGWELKKDGEDWYIASGGGVICEVIGGHKSYDCPKSKEEGESNARLIAAAPEMYELLSMVDVRVDVVRILLDKIDGREVSDDT